MFEAGRKQKHNLRGLQAGVLLVMVPRPDKWEEGHPSQTGRSIHRDDCPLQIREQQKVRNRFKMATK